MNNNKAEGVPLSTGTTGRDAGLAGAPNPAEAVGARLAAVRVEKGRTVDEMSSRLKVPPAKVMAIESGDLAVLHDAAFAVGLVRSYAKVLGMDPEPLTDALRGVQTPTSDLSSLPQSSAKQPSMRRANVPLSWSTRRSDRRSWIWGGLAAFVVLVLLVVWRAGNEPNGWLQKVRGEAKSDIAMANPNTASQVDVNDVSTQTSGAVVTTLPSAGGAASGDMASGSGGNASTNVTAALAAPSNALVAAASDAGSAAASTLAAVSAPGAASVPAVTAASAVPVPVGAVPVTLTATHDSWVSISQADGRTVFSGIVRAGQTQQAAGVRPLRVVIGNMSGISAITQDGQPVDLSAYAKAGHNVVRLTLR